MIPEAMDLEEVIDVSNLEPPNVKICPRRAPGPFRWHDIDAAGDRSPPSCRVSAATPLHVVVVDATAEGVT